MIQTAPTCMAWTKASSAACARAGWWVAAAACRACSAETRAWSRTGPGTPCSEGSIARRYTSDMIVPPTAIPITLPVWRTVLVTADRHRPGPAAAC